MCIVQWFDSCMIAGLVTCITWKLEKKCFFFLKESAWVKRLAEYTGVVLRLQSSINYLFQRVNFDLTSASFSSNDFFVKFFIHLKRNYVSAKQSNKGVKVRSVTFAPAGNAYIQNFLCATLFIPYSPFKLNKLILKMNTTTILPLLKVEMGNLVVLFSLLHTKDFSGLFSHAVFSIIICKSWGWFYKKI